MKRTLLTWSDRTAAFQRRRQSGDLGPVLRLCTHTDEPYERVVVFAGRRERAATRDLVRELHSMGIETEQVESPVDDPSDHQALFGWVGALAVETRWPGAIDVLLSAGTPQAQTVWILLVKAGLLDARMMQVIPPQFVPVPHPHPVRVVTLEFDGFPEIVAMKDELIRLRAQLGSASTELIGTSKAMRRVSERLLRVAATDVPLVVHGETGTGKELVAKAVHASSSRAHAPFVAVNCGTLSETLLESELFGHEQGAFTGAHKHRRGLFEQASGGTLFLDEVGEMTPATQVRLLRALQEGEIRRVGSETTVRVDVRVIAATHRDLRAMTRAGEFREDLYYRLRGATLELPPLRHRENDIELLVAHFLADAGHGDLRPTRRAWQAVLRYPWPGNVRELQSEVRRWTVFCDDHVRTEDLSPELLETAPHPPSPAVVAPPSASLPDAVAALEETLIVETLAATQGNLSATARQLGIDRNTLKRKMKRFQLKG